MKVFVNGSFDVLHKGHLSLLERAKSLGDFLIVAIDSDRRIKELKGYDRPFNNEENRYELMKALRWVDQVEIFDTDEDLINILKKHSPDIMLKGSDWRGKEVIGQDLVKEVQFYDRVDNESTTNTIERFIAGRHMHR